MKLRLPSLLRRLLVSAMTVTTVTLGTSNSGATSTTTESQSSSGSSFTLNALQWLTSLADESEDTQALTLSTEEEADAASVFGDTAGENPAAWVADDVQEEALALSEIPTMSESESGGSASQVGEGGVSTGGVQTAAQPLALSRSTTAAEPAAASAPAAAAYDVALADAEETSTYLWDATSESENTWSQSQFSTQAVSTDGASVSFGSTDGVYKTVNVTDNVSAGGMSISGGGYSFSGGAISLSDSLSVSGGGDASSIEQIHIPTGPITVNGSELTIVQLTPTNPSAPIELFDAAKLTIGSEDHRYGSFSGTVMGDDGSELHLYTTQVSNSYWQEDGTVRLSEGSTVKDVYIHGDLALNIIASKQGEEDWGDLKTTVQGANLHMDAGSQLVVRADEGANDPLVPTTGDIVMHGDLNIVAYANVTTNTAITSDFVLAENATGTLIKKQTLNEAGTDATGSITLSGAINVSGISVEAGTLKLTGTSIQSNTIDVAQNATLEFAATKNGYTAANISGGGTVVLNLSEPSGWDNRLNVGANFTGTTELNSGRFIINDAVVGQTLQLNNGVDGFILNAAYTFTKDLVVNSAIQVHQNGGVNLTMDGSVTGTGSWDRRSSGTLTFNGTVELGGFTQNSDSRAINIFNNTTKITTATIANGTTTFKGNLNLTTLTQTGGTVRLENSDTLTGANKHIASLIIGDADGGAVFEVNNTKNSGNITTLDVVKVNGIASLGTYRDRLCWNGTINITSLENAVENADAALTLTNGSKIDAASVINVNGGDFRGTLNVKANSEGSGSAKRKFAVNVNHTDVLADAVVSFQEADTEGDRDENYAALGLGATTVNLAGISGDTTNAAEIHSYQINAGGAFTNKADANDTAARTLVLNVTSETPLTTNAKILDNISLVKKGSGSQTFSGVANVDDVSVSNGTLALSNTGSVVHGDISVSGGALDLDATYTLGAEQSLSIATAESGAVSLAGLVLAGGEIIFDATALSSDTAALSVGTLSLGTGTTSQTISFTHADELASGRYMLAGSWTALDGLSSFASTGLNNGTATYTVQNGALYMDYVNTMNYTWTGAADGNWNYSAANWDTDAAAADTAFVANKVAIFENNANVTVSEAVSASKLIVREGATLTLTETATLTAAAIEVDAGSTLTFATAKAGRTANISGAGIVEVALTEAYGNALNLGADFEGETHVTSGQFTISGAQVGKKLVLADGVDMQSNYPSGQSSGTYQTIVNADIVLEGVTIIHANSSRPITYAGSFTGENGDFRSAASASHTFNGLVDIKQFKTEGSAAVNFNKETSIDNVIINQATVNFNGITDITTATLSGGTTNIGANAEATITSLSISGGTLNVNGTADITTLAISGGTTNFMQESIGGEGSTITMTGGTLQLNKTGDSSNQSVYSDIVVNNTSGGASTSIIKNDAGAESMHRTLNSVSIAANNTLELQQTSWNTIWQINDLSGEGDLTWLASTTHWTASILRLQGDGSDYSGAVKLDWNTSVENRQYQAYIEVNSNDAVKGATVELDGVDANGVASLALHTDNATMQGLIGNAHSHLFAGAAPTTIGSNSNSAHIDAALASTANNTLTLAGSETYTFAGTVGTAAETAHLNLAMIGSGSQTFSGVAHVGNVSVSNGTLALSNTGSVVHGDISVSGGSFTLGSTYTLGSGQVLSVLTETSEAVTLGGISLAGGKMVFDASLLKDSTAALTLTNVATTAENGGATVTLDFSKLSGALATGQYLLATGNWEGATGLTYSGTGSATLSATDAGLYLNYTNDSVYTWVGGATAGEGTEDTAWTSANWDLVVDENAENNASWTSGKDAIFNTTATVSVTDAVTAATVSILNGAQVTLTQSGEAPSLTVEHLLVGNGKLTLGAQINWTGIKDITVKESGTLSLGWGTGLSATSLLLQGGTVELNNGGGNNNHLNAAITVEGSATINGSSTGDNTDIQGSITGNGVLNIGKTHDDRNPIKISASMTDGATGPLAVNIIDASVIYSGAKRYTGGTTIGATGTLTVNAGGEKGGMVGEIDVYGTLKLNTGDATGWGTSEHTVSSINVYAGGILNASNTDGNQTGSGIAINLLGGTMRGNNFDLAYGGSTRGYSTITALAADGATAESPTVSTIESSSITLRQRVNVFDVQENARLNITGVIAPGTGTSGDKNYINGDPSTNGDMTFTKIGLGELVLSGANTFTAATTIQAGTLTLANGGTMKSAVTVNEGATFKLLADTAAVSYDQAISGAGTVVKAGANTATLSAANLSLTALDVQAGFVAATRGLTVNALSVAENAGFAYDLSSDPALVTANGYNAAITFRLNNMAAVGRTYDVFQAAAGMSAAHVTLTGYDTNTYQTITSVSESGLVSIGVYYAGLVWNTAGATDAWNTTDTNWNNAATATTYTDGSKVTFDGTGETVTIDGTVAPGDVVVRGTDYTLSGGTIASTGRLSVLSGAGLTLTQAATFAGGVTVDGTLGYNVAAGQEINFTNAISGSGELHKTGEGTLNLGALSNYKGTTTLKVSEGVLKFAGMSGEEAENTPYFIKVLNKLETSGSGKLLVEGDVAYNYQGNEENQRVITVDDAIEITGGWNINSWGTTGNNGYRQYKLADGADVTVGGVLWLTNKQEMVVQNGAVLNANGGIKLGHDDGTQSDSSNFTSRFVVEGGEVKTTGITFRRDGKPRTGNAFIMTGGRVEFAPATATTNVIQKLNDGDGGTGAIENGEVSLTGGTLVAGDSSWLMDAGSATNFHVYGVTFETAADKSITLAGNINFTPAEGANGTITKTGEGLLVFNVADKTLAGLDIQGGWVQTQQNINLSALTLAEGAGFAYDLSGGAATLVTADSYTGDLNFRLDNLTAGDYDLFRGSAEGSWTSENVTLSGYNADKYTVTVNSDAGLVSIHVAYAGLLWDTDHSETNTWVAADGETSWNAGEGTDNVAYSGSAKAIFAGEGEEITISGEVTPECIIVSGTGYAFVGEEGSIGGTGKLTVENGADLTISTSNTYTGGTVIEEGGTLEITNAQALGGSGENGVLGKVSGAGTLVLNFGSAEQTAVASGTGDAANMGGFTGTVDITSGQLYLGGIPGGGALANADFGASKVIVRADGALNMMYLAKTQLHSTIDLMNGAELNQRGNYVMLQGPIRFNIIDPDAETPTYNSNGVVALHNYAGTVVELNGALEGSGTVEMYTPNNSLDYALYGINSENNTFDGTFKLMDGDGEGKTLSLNLVQETSAEFAAIHLATEHNTSILKLYSSATIRRLDGVAGVNNAVQAQNDARTLTVSEGNFAGQLKDGSAQNTLALNKVGSGTLTLSGANTYTGGTTVSEGTLELAGAVSMAAESHIALQANTTLLLNATNDAAMTLGNAISGTGDIHKKGAYETVLTGDVTATNINVKDGDTQKFNAGTLTLTGESVKANTLYVAYGQLNIGAKTDGNTFMVVDKVELGDSSEGNSTVGLAIREGSTLSITGNNNGTGSGWNPHKNASLLVSEWNAEGTLDVQGKLLVQNANVSLGDDKSTININGGTLAAQAIAQVRESTGGALELNLSNDGTLIVGANGISTTADDVKLNLGAGTVGMSAAETTIAENLTLTDGTTGTTFDTTQYAFETNAENVATDIVRGTEGGTMTISGNINAANAKMNVAGAGTLQMTGAVTLGSLNVQSGATAVFSGGIAHTAMSDGTLSNTQVSGAGLLKLQAGTGSVKANVVLDEFTGRVNVANSTLLTANITVEANEGGAATKLDGTHNITDTTLYLTLNDGAKLLGDMTGNKTIEIAELNVVGNATFGTAGEVDSTYKGYQSTFTIESLQRIRRTGAPTTGTLRLESGSNTADCTIFNVQDMYGYAGDIVVSAQNTGNNRRVALNLDYAGTPKTALWYSQTVVELDTATDDSIDDKAGLGVVYDTVLKGIKGEDTSGVIVAGKITNSTFDSTATNHVTLTLGSWDETEDFESEAAIKSKLNLYKQGSNTQTFSGDTTAFDGSVTVAEGELAFGTSSLKTASTVVGKHVVTMDEEMGEATATAIPKLSYGDGCVTVEANRGMNDAKLGAAQFSYSDNMVTISSHTPAEGAEQEKITAQNSLITIAEGASLKVDHMIISDSSRISGTAAAATYAARTAGSVSELTLTDSTVVLGADNDSVVGATTSRTLTDLQPMGGNTGSEALTLSGTSKVLTITSNALSNLAVTAGSDFLVDFSYLLTISSLKDVDFIELNFNNVAISAAEDVSITGLLSGSQLTAYYMTPAETAVANVGTAIYFDVRAVPEPTTTTLSVLALAGLMLRRRRK